VTEQTTFATSRSKTPSVSCTPKVSELRECDFGTWTARTLVDVAFEDASALDTWLRDAYAAPHDGESLAELINRVGRLLDDHPWPKVEVSPW
jgi:broad specificity phosphatase PhoE